MGICIPYEFQLSASVKACIRSQAPRKIGRHLLVGHLGEGIGQGEGRTGSGLQYNPTMAVDLKFKIIIQSLQGGFRRDHCIVGAGHLIEPIVGRKFQVLKVIGRLHIGYIEFSQRNPFGGSHRSGNLQPHFCGKGRVLVVDIRRRIDEVYCDFIRTGTTHGKNICRVYDLIQRNVLYGRAC